MNGLIDFTSNIVDIIANDNFAKKSDDRVKNKVANDKPNNFTGLFPVDSVLVSNPSGNISTSSINKTVLEKLKGVRSNIQTQIDNIPSSLIISSNEIEQQINVMKNNLLNYQKSVEKLLHTKQNAFSIDELSPGVNNKIIRNGNYFGNLNVDGTISASNYIINGNIVKTNTVDVNYNTDVIEIVNMSNAPALSIVNNISSNILSIKTRESEKVTISSDGNIGIGITNPREKVDVNGNIRIDGTINGITKQELLNFKNVNENIQEQIDYISAKIYSFSGNIDANLSINDRANIQNYIAHLKDQLNIKISEAESNVSNYIDNEYENLVIDKQNKITFGEGFIYDSNNNSLSLSLSNTNSLWKDNANPKSLSYANVAIYGDRIEVNENRVVTVSELNTKQNIVTGAVSTILSTDLPTNKILITNADGKIATSDVANSILNNVSGLTEFVQTKLDTILSDVILTSNEFNVIIDSNVQNSSNYVRNIASEFEQTLSNLYEPITFTNGLVYDDATKTLGTDGTYVYQGSVSTSDSLWTSNKNYINYKNIKVYSDHVTVNDSNVATKNDLDAKLDVISDLYGLKMSSSEISVDIPVWEDKGHYIRYKNTRIYNNRVTVGIDDTIDVKKYPPIGLPGITGSEQSGVMKTISGHTYGNGSYKVEWSSDTGEHNPSLLFNGNQNEGAGAHTGAFYNSNGEIIPYSGSSYHYLVSDYYGEWISLEFPERIYFTFIKLHPRRAYPYVSPKDYKVYGQNNDLTWDEILHVSDAIYSNNVHVSGHYSPKKSYKKYGLVVNKVFSPGTILNFSEIEFFGIPDEILYVTTDEFAEDTTDMLAWYKFDGVNGEIDSSGNDKTATVTGNPVPSENMLSITKDNYLTLPGDIIDFDNDICISFWYRFDNEDVMARIFSFAKDTNIMSHANKILLSRGGIGEEFEFIVDANKATINFGHITGGDLIHVTWVIKKDGTWIIYKNGVQIYNTVHIYPTTNTYTHSYLGKSNWYTEFNDDNQITMRDLRFYNRALTSEEVRVLYRVGKPVLYDFFADTSDMLAWYKFDGDLSDSSGNGNQPLIYSGTNEYDNAIMKTGISSLKFNGSTSYVCTPSSGSDPFNSKHITISFWHYSTTTSSNFQAILSTRPSQGLYGWTVYINPNGTDSHLQFGTGTTWNSISSGPWPSDGSWRHICYMVDENNIGTSYINGVLIDTSTLGNLANTSTALYIGANIGGTQYKLINGTRLDDVRFYNRALTPDEVHTLYAKSGMISDGHVELHNIKADKLMPYNDSSINIGKHVKIRASVGVAENLSSRVVNSDTDIVETRENPYAMKLEKDLWMDGAGIIWTSDERIKKEIVDIDDNVALQQILAIEPKTYKYIDDATKGDATVYGFISQQIEEVIPEATKKTSRYIPNIYQICEYSSTNNSILLPNNFDISDLNTLYSDRFTSNYEEMTSNIVITNENHLSHNLKIIDKKQEIIVNYSMSSNENGYELKILNPEFTVDYNTSNLFVYGTEIKDLVTLDKSYIYTLNTCATQVLSRKVESLADENSLLLNQIEMLENRIGIIREYINMSSNSSNNM